MRLLSLLVVLLAACPAPVASILCYVDGDGDGFGQLATLDQDSCDAEGFSAEGGDCVDDDPDVYPDAEEESDDGIDQDCNGVDAASCRADEDNDGWGGGGVYDDLDGDCYDQGDLPAGEYGDCDDSNAAVNPVMPEIPDDGLDNDCRGGDSTVCYWDGDGDGYGAPVDFVSADDDCDDAGEAAQPGDCDDSADWIFPGAQDEPGDGYDADCDGVDPALCFVDADGDAFGGEETVVEPSGTCELPGLTWYGGDCDDTTPLFSPFAFDTPGDGLDQNCDGVDSAQCYYDGDEDGYGWTGGGYADVDGDCTDDPFQSALDGDCADWDPAIHPGAEDVPDDGVDADCNGAP